ncbi:hypothetical protein OpiT1DRAFT_02249 [Opitutaceae bacterium TAV1]|nr:hypothetical protein OpiT1DRAFT_02249 [Opitutaceae bacterium TAV1]
MPAHTGKTAAFLPVPDKGHAPPGNLDKTDNPGNGRDAFSGHPGRIAATHKAYPGTNITRARHNRRSSHVPARLTPHILFTTCRLP